MIMAAPARLSRTWGAISTSTTSTDRTRHWITVLLPTFITRTVQCHLISSEQRRSPPYYETFSCLKTLVHLIRVGLLQHICSSDLNESSIPII